jgi:hypothetical protein
MQGRSIRLPKDDFAPFKIERVDEDDSLWEDSDFDLSDSDEEECENQLDA